MAELERHAAIVCANEALFDAPLGDDAEILRTLAERWGRLTVVVAAHAARRDRWLSERVHLVAVPARPLPRAVPALRRAILAAHRHTPLDLIQAQEPAFTGTAALLAGRAAGCPVVLCAFGTDPWDAGFTRASARHRLAGALGRRTLAHASAVQVDSRAVAAALERRGLPVRYKPMTPVNLAAFHAAGARRRHRDRGETVLFVGRLGPQKRLELLLHAVAWLRAAGRPVRLVLVGDGPDRDLVRGRAAALGIDAHVVLRGPVPHHELIPAYLEADVLALTSRYEGMPRVLLEAAATALPIVSTPVAGARELSDRAPVTIAAADPERFAGALAGLLDDVHGRRAAGAALRAAMAERMAEPAAPDVQLEVWERLTRPRLAVVLPELDPEAATHYVHYVPLLRELARRTDLSVIVEKGGAPRFPEMDVVAQRYARPAARALELGRILVAQRRRGVRVAYGSYSPYFGVVGGVIGRLAGIRTAYWHCRSDYFDRSIGRRRGLRAHLVDSLPFVASLHAAGRVVTGTETLADRYARTFRLPRHKVRVVPNDVDVGAFPPRAERAGEPPTVLFVHRLSEHQGSHLIAPVMRRVWADYPDVRLLVAGGGPDEARVRAALREELLTERARLLGYVANPQVRRLMAASTVLLMPSLTEGFPRVLLEAMAAGLPFVASDVGGVREIVPAGAAARLVAPGDGDALARRTSELLADPALRDELRAEGLAHVRRYDTRAVADVFLREVCGP